MSIVPRERALLVRTVLLATRNPGKFAEFETLFADAGFAATDLRTARVLYLPDEDHLELHATFEANALAKARYFHAASGGTPTVADDSGIEVDALGGAPGVLSRRWANASGDEHTVTQANNRELLNRLRGRTHRTARFTCVVAYVDTERELTCRGEVLGRIATRPRGAHGFGYDPIFEVTELGGRTFGEVSRAEKHSISHRARAFASLAVTLHAGKARSSR